jgi:membrane protein DedA with SNARE-associated domain
MSIILLGAYTAKLELFKFFFFLAVGTLIWSFFLYYESLGSNSYKRKKRRAIILMVVSAVLVAGMSVTWLLSKTNMGWWWES